MIESEKIPVDEDTILVGHSRGCAFLVRWLGDTKARAKKLVMVAPWKVAVGNNERKMEFYRFDIDPAIRERVEEIILFTSDDEEKEGKRSLEIYRNALGGEVVSLKGHGHYTLEDMGTGEFPELLGKITS